MSSEYLTKEDVAKKLKIDVELVSKAIENDGLPGFETVGVWRTTEDALGKWSDAKMAQGMAVPATIAVGPAPLPTLAEARAADWVQVAPTKYYSRNGKLVEWKENAYTAIFTIGGKSFPITIAIFGPKGGVSKGVSYKHWGAEVYKGELGHGLQGICEWTRTDDFDKTREIASVIKAGSRFVLPGEAVESEFDELTLDSYRRLNKRPNIKNARCVVAKEDDFGAIALHALIRCRQKGWI
ncbi:MAG: hypothetical protein QM758_05745 [Armatimonas sp.]